MAHPPAQSTPSDPGPALTRAAPGFARRLGFGSPPADGSSPPDRPPLRSPRRLPFPKRVERYVSALLKLGRTYGTVKEMTRYLDGHDTRIDGISGTVAALHERQNHDADRLHDLEKHFEEQDDQALHDHLADMEKRLAEAQDGLARDLDDRLSEVDDRNAKTADRLRTQLDETARDLRARLSRGETERAGLSRAYGDLSRRLDMARAGDGALPVPAPEMSGLDALMESFYARLEDRYRGSREEIRKRLLKYLPDAEGAVARTGKPVLDLGCGRGEWLELLRGNGIEGTGVDLNEMQLRDARALGLDVHLVDACRFLADAPDASYGMITAHHLAEHLPFRTLVWMTRETLRVLAPGGVLLYETPNIGNILVGASTFHIDPTHLRPLPAEVLTTLYDTIGFHPVESRFLHPYDNYDELARESSFGPDIARLLFGPQDLAVLGTRPGEAA